MADRRPELRRSMTLSEQLSTPDQAIRDFLKIPNDDSHLEDADRTAADSGGMWKPLRDRLRLRRAANTWSSTPSQKSPSTSSDGGGTTGGNLKNNNNRSNKYIYAPGEATAAFSRTTSLRQTPTFSRATSTRVGPNAAIGRMDRAREIGREEASDEESEHDEEEDEDDEEKDNEEDAEAPAAQMSLMALLGQSDNTWDVDDEDEEGDGGAGASGGRGGAGNKGAAHGGDEDEDDGDGEGREEEMVHVCCVCMVRHKGAAFIPCGHTFCRLCSRELWVSRGNCPLCNGFIQEILDIF